MFHMANLAVQFEEALQALLDVANLKPQDIFVLGCSTSEIAGQRIGTGTNLDIAKAIFSILYPKLEELGIFAAFQCCEHLNRALVTSPECAKTYKLDEVSVIPHLQAGGAMATWAMKNIPQAVVVEKISAHAGMDIGDTFIGMHLKRVVVPVRAKIQKIACANLTLARTRPPLIGGERAIYPDGANIK